MRVAFITQWWGAHPEGVIPGIATALREQGAVVDVFAGRRGLDGSRSGPIWPLRQRGSWSGSQVRTYPYYWSHDGSAPKRLLTYGTFAATSGLSAADLRTYDVALVYGSPATAVVPALVGKAFFNVPFVFHVQDVWPDSIFATGFLQAGRVRRAAEATAGSLVNAAYRQAAGVVAISPGMRDLLVSRGVPATKAHYVYNWVSGDSGIEPISVPARDHNQPLHLMYAGAIGFAQNLDNVLAALGLLPSGMVQLSLVGDGPATEALREQAGQLGLTNVDFVGRISRDKVPELQATSHLNLISLADEELFRITLPSKLQALAAHGAPILCTAPGEASAIVEANGMGVTAPPGDPQQLADAIMAASELTTDQLRDMGNNGRAFYRREMSESQGAERLMRILEAAAQDRRRR